MPLGNLFFKTHNDHMNEGQNKDFKIMLLGTKFLKTKSHFKRIFEYKVQFDLSKVHNYPLVEV
jgi:hypothetical protein